MMKIRTTLALLAALVATPAVAQQPAPAASRLPETPLVYEPGRADWTPGQTGGDLRMLIARTQDVRMMVVYGYARLVGFTPDYELKPDILRDIKVEGDRVFTMHLRPGHRWSDGAPFTAEDFRYFWEDVANDKQLSPSGPPNNLLVEGKPPKVEILDAVTVRYSWDAPNPAFLPALAGPSPLYIYRPSAYLKKFHGKYADKDQLEALVKETGVRNWATLHNRRDNMYRNDNPDLPSLEPWVLQTRPPADRFVFVRNPYFHRVDSKGTQLPYIDRVIMNVADGRILPAKTGAGESDLQARNLSFSNYTFLREASKRNDFQVTLWNSAKGAHLALYPNLNANDPAWRKLNRDPRFRHALSLAIDRKLISQVIYFGLAIEGANTVLPQSKLYKKEYREAWSKFDLRQAKKLLDELGLTKTDSRGVRLLPDGRPMEIIVETAGEDTEQTDVLELVHETWLQAGIKLFSRPLQREVFRNRIFAGDTTMSIWGGLENGLPTADMTPEELAPVSQQWLQWPKWGQYYETAGSSGEAPDTPEGKELLELYKSWLKAGSTDERAKIWHRMLAIHAENTFSIGLIAGVKQPMVVNNALRNVPKEGVYNWDPGSFFGMYRMDGFWMAKAAGR